MLKLKQSKNEDDPYKRVILHLDLDCFYAQVEHNRLKISLTVPLAVLQWSGLIAGESFGLGIIIHFTNYTKS